MSIKEIKEKIKGFLLSREGDLHTLFVALMLILVGTSAFGLGRLSMVSKQAPTIEYSPQLASSAAATEDALIDEEVLPGAVVASKKGTKYHFPWCSGARTIASENKITFSSVEEARKAGYTPAANCKGLE